ncbi:unnamed protein product [Effrenium voratum]|nr:unnamed protein product [Effrenium voratum]
MNVASLQLDDGLDLSKLAQQDFVLKVLKDKLVYEWAAPEPFSRSFSRAKVEMSISSIKMKVSEISPLRTKVEVQLSQEPKVDIGLQDWDAKLGRRRRTKWLGLGKTDVGCEALPSGCRQICLKARSHELILCHTLPKVQEYLSKMKLTDPPPVKRPLSAYNQLQKALAVVNKKARKEKMRGSDGARCDGCGLEEEDEDCDELEIVCERCLYTACGNCVVDHCHGTCYCKKG